MEFECYLQMAKQMEFDITYRWLLKWNLSLFTDTFSHPWLSLESPRFHRGTVDPKKMKFECYLQMAKKWNLILPQMAFEMEFDFTYRWLRKNGI